MSSRPKLTMVDDPVARHSPQAPETLPPTQQPPPEQSRTPPAPATVARADSAHTNSTAQAHTAAEAAPEPPERSQPDRYSQEPKKAVFGRVPRSLSKRLERAVLELREDADDLTQEQVLAALLEKYVNPADSGNLTALRATVNEYRSRL